ncbi:MAG: molybdopterin-guanine dinucleotide biosynthesis protein B [Clostridiales bacterium]|nr:molybdopterin-guanine dinucleotide biosynthesis protein B [Clostridiales bacterium]
MENIPVIGIAAHGANKGKTRLLLALLRELRAKGLRVCVLKHGQHVFLPPEKDSSLFMQAGAAASLIVTPEGWLLAAAPEQEPDFLVAARMLAQSCHADLLLVEGYKQGPHPKLLLTGEALTKEMLLPHTLALISDATQHLPLPCFAVEGSAAIAGFIIKYMQTNDRYSVF